MEMRIEDTTEIEMPNSNNVIDSGDYFDLDELACEEEIDHQKVTLTMDTRDNKTTLRNAKQFDTLFDNSYLEQLKTTSQDVKKVHDS